MSFGSACHLYAGAISRGRSGRTLVGEGSEGLNESCGHANSALFEAWKVGVVYAAVLVYGTRRERTASGSQLVRDMHITHR